MSFDLQKYEGAKFVPREENVPVPELKDFFDEDEKPEFKVRNLDGPEIAVARTAMQRNRSLETMVEGLSSQIHDEKVNAVKEALGITSDTSPDDYVYRVSVLHQGCVDPQLDESQAVRIASTHGVVFYKLTNKILQLTGMGKTLGE